ncbi:MAG TPA: hypothetical protein ENJ19_07055 [Gammaproteobacteria bacterium]|nr:hypothetical protein [Gammaproteobacteria bacterium]
MFNDDKSLFAAAGVQIAAADKGDQPCHRVREIIHYRIASHGERLRQAGNLQSGFESALWQWRCHPNGGPGGTAVGRLPEPC